ncbi:gametocyte-specific factor 1 homolog [Planococcus citri]|uniref:gametocyte-specific factor 1 homolog n=1 Tax=Planococcus citri TaxID=170843 RepID=UPI0031FA40DA
MDDSERFEDAQNFVTCPYNAAHSCPKFRMARHLVKCRRQHEEVAKEQRVCPFNSTHIIPQIELAYHETICPDRELFYTYTHKTEDSQNPVVEELYKNTMKKVEIPSDENWDDEINPDVNIIERCKKNALDRGVLQSNSNEPPAERKALRLEQRMRTRERMNAEEEKKKIHLMNQPPHEDSESVASYRTMTSGPSSYSFGTARNTVEKKMGGVSKPESTSSTSRGRGKNAPKVSSNYEMGFGRGRR